MQKTLGEIARIIDGEIVGNPDVLITGICGIREASEGDLTFIANSKYAGLMETTKASAIITSREVNSSSKPIIRTDNPSLAFAKMLSLLSPSEIEYPKGIHPAAVIGENVRIGKNVAIQAFCVIEDGAEIGDDSILYAGVYVGNNTKIGKNALIYPSVSIRERIEIGDRVIIHSGSVIGSDGFGFVVVQGVHHKIPQVGTVVIENDVEIGANVTIDRARFDKTIIGRGSKIDNLVQIAHNVIIGENSIVVAQAGISGSTSIGKNVILAGQTGIVGHISIGDGAIVAAQAGVTKSVPANTTVSGYPARPHSIAKRVNACLQKLPELYKTVHRLNNEISELKKEMEHLRENTKQREG
ncbi:MAG: UDP-3-O-(3-hydroxymyristoyl)glucosamine N-acyltransferase [Candidatus Omnitrophota bacterium]